MKRSGILVLLLCHVVFIQSQTLSLGMGLYQSDQETFKQGKKINFEFGLRIGSSFMPGFAFSLGLSPTTTEVHPRIIRYEGDGPIWGKPMDTLYNVGETNQYEFNRYLFKVRIFFIPPDSKPRVKFYFAPAIGFTTLIEKKSYQHPDYNSSSRHAVLSYTWACNLGIECALDKKHRLLLDLQFEPLLIKSQNIILDGYFPPFSRRDTIMSSINLNLRWEFGKEYHK